MEPGERRAHILMQQLSTLRNDKVAKRKKKSAERREITKARQEREERKFRPAVQEEKRKRAAKAQADLSRKRAKMESGGRF